MNKLKKKTIFLRHFYNHIINNLFSLVTAIRALLLYHYFFEELARVDNDFGRNVCLDFINSPKIDAEYYTFEIITTKRSQRKSYDQKLIDVIFFIFIYRDIFYIIGNFCRRNKKCFDSHYVMASRFL